MSKALPATTTAPLASGAFTLEALLLAIDASEHSTLAWADEKKLLELKSFTQTMKLRH